MEDGFRARPSLFWGGGYRGASILFEIQIRLPPLQQIGLNINKELKDPLVDEIFMTFS